MKLSIPASKVIQAVSVMKLSALVEEVNQEQELLELCDKLCKDLYTVHCNRIQAWTTTLGVLTLKVGSTLR